MALIMVGYISLVDGISYGTVLQFIVDKMSDPNILIESDVILLVTLKCLTITNLIQQKRTEQC